MTLEERAACIADISLQAVYGKNRRQRIYAKALQMLRDTADEARASLPIPADAFADALKRHERERG